MRRLIILPLLCFGLAVSAHETSDLVRDALSYRDNPTDSARTAFNDKYLQVREGTSLSAKPHPLYPDSTFYGSGRLDDNILPLAFGIVPEEVRRQVADNVAVTIIRKCKYRPAVSPAVEPYVLGTLAENGWNHLAYFICDKHPEMVTDDCISDEYVKAWRERYVAGVSVDGDRLLRLKPDFSIQELDTLDCNVQTELGEVGCSFTKDLMHAEWYFSIPRGVRAEVWTPASDKSQVRRRCLARRLRTADGWTVWRVRGGKHHFSVDFDKAPGIVEEQFVYKKEDFPQCHGSTLCFAENGDLLSSFYGGTSEHNPDTKVRLCRKPAGSDEWTRPEAVAVPDKEGYCLDNPVLFRVPEPGRPMLLFYKIRPGFHMKEGEIDLRTIAFWEGRLKRSYDNGLTWSETEMLPEGFLGPVKDKPIWYGGRIVMGSSYESKYHHEGSRIHFELTDPDCKNWIFTQPDSVELSIPCSLRKHGRAGTNVDVPANPDYYYGNWNPIFSIQPTILVHKDGSLQALCRTSSGKMSVTRSYDGGLTWPSETLTDMPQNGSGIDAVTMPDGRFALVYNDFETIPGHSGGPRSPLKVAVSDDGVNWTDAVTLEDDCIKEYSYPAVICDEDGYLHISYTWRRYRVKYVKLKLD